MNTLSIAVFVAALALCTARPGAPIAAPVAYAPAIAKVAAPVAYAPTIGVINAFSPLGTYSDAPHLGYFLPQAAPVAKVFAAPVVKTLAAPLTKAVAAPVAYAGYH